MGKRPVKLQREEADIIRRFDALDPKPLDKAMAETAGIDPNKISRVRAGIRRFKARELDRIRPWLEEIEALQLHDRPSLSAPAAVSDHRATYTADAGEVVDILAVDLSYAMGDGRDIDDYVETEPVKFDLGLIRSITRSPPHRLRLARGLGDSMLPTLQSSDRVMIDTTQNMLKLDDRIYAISRFGAGSIKRLRVAGPGRVMIVSDNPLVEDREVDAADLIIHGRVIWLQRDL